MKPVYNYEDAVQNGLALLDEKYPGWTNLIHLDTLNMSNPYVCICGQLYGGFSKGLTELGLTFGTDELYGLDIFKGEEYDEEAYEHLGDLWSEAIVQRIEGGV